eukprot:2278024-Rhodomonas_salina.4
MAGHVTRVTRYNAQWPIRESHREKVFEQQTARPRISAPPPGYPADFLHPRQFSLVYISDTRLF